MVGWTPNRYGLKISELVKSAIRPLNKTEYAGLESAIIVACGAKLPILVRRDTNEILDGMNRWEICERHKFDYKIEIVDVSSDVDALRVAIQCQQNRRNLNDAELTKLAGALSKACKAGGKLKLPAGSLSATAAATGKSVHSVKRAMANAKIEEKIASAIKKHTTSNAIKLPAKVKTALAKLAIAEQNQLHDAAKETEDSAGYIAALKERLVSAQVLKPAPQQPCDWADDSADGTIAEQDQTANEEGQEGQDEQPGEHHVQCSPAEERTTEITASDVGKNGKHVKPSAFDALTAVLKKFSAVIRDIDAIDKSAEQYAAARKAANALYETLLVWRNETAEQEVEAW